MAENKVCPISVTGKPINCIPLSDYRCIGDKCAWWVPMYNGNSGKCAVQFNAMKNIE